MSIFASNVLIFIVSFDLTNSSILWAKLDALASSFSFYFAFLFNLASPHFFLLSPHHYHHPILARPLA
jgi:hypothetical protein